MRPGRPERGISREGSCAVNENGPEIIDIGQGWPGQQKIVELGEKYHGVVVGKKRGRIEAKGAGAACAQPVGKGACGVAGPAAAPVGSVRVRSQGDNALHAVQRKRQGKSIFLIGAAASLAADRHGKLAPG